MRASVQQAVAQSHPVHVSEHNTECITTYACAATSAISAAQTVAQSHPVHVNEHSTECISTYACAARSAISATWSAQRQCMRGYVSLYTCGYVSLYTCGYVSLYTCGYVSLYVWVREYTRVGT